MVSSALRSRLAAEHLPLVHHLVHRVARRLPPHVNLDDLVGAGLLGLATAIDRYDHRRRTRFKAYAEYRIRGEIMDELRRLDVLSRDQRGQSKRMAEARRSLCASLHREATTEEVAASLGIPADRCHRVEQAQQAAMTTLPAEMLCAELAHEGPDPCDEAEVQEMQAKLASVIDRLPRQQRLVLWLYYYEDLSPHEIAAVLGVTPSRICQIRGAAVASLQALLEVSA
jgi:RNA polymerase sigma factor for flagellar operon FliA